MLKLNYTNCGLYLEQVAAPLEIAIAQRVMLAISTGQTLCVEPGRASFLLSVDIPGLSGLRLLLDTEHLEREQEGAIAISAVESDYVEVCLQGTWIAPNAAAEEGALMAALHPETEATLYQLWQVSQFQLASIA